MEQQSWVQRFSVFYVCAWIRETLIQGMEQGVKRLEFCQLAAEAKFRSYIINIVVK